MSIRADHISKSWSGFNALTDVSLEVRDGEFVALLGPSGSGKTTLLRIIAGLESADSGNVFLHGEDSTALHVQERQVGFVFQHYAVFRHMTVEQNVAFGLNAKPRRERLPKVKILQRVRELLRLVHLEEFAARMPDQLSGGQRQRVALARALAIEPKVLLLDEPFGALDAQVRMKLRRWLRGLQQELGLTTVIVTHDQEEAMEIADRIVVMREGRIEQVGTSTELWDHPRNEFVFDFLGHSNLLQGHQKGNRIEMSGIAVRSAGLDCGSLNVGMRSFDIKVWVDPQGKCSLAHMSPFGDLMRLQVRLPDGETISVQMPQRSSLLQGMKVGCRVHVEPTRWFLFKDGARIDASINSHLIPSLAM